MAIVVKLIWVLVVLNLALSNSHFINKRYSSLSTNNNCKSDNVNFKPDSLPYEHEKLNYNTMPPNLRKFIEWYYNNNTNCENGKYIRSERNKRFSDCANATITFDMRVYKPHRSKRDTFKTDLLTMVVIYLEKMSWNRNDSALTLAMEKNLCHTNKESCGLFNKRSFQPFNKNRNIDFGDILACDLPNTSGRRIVHYMMGFNSSNLVIEGTGNIDSEHPSNKIVVQFSKLNQKDNIFSKCFYLPLKDKSDENIAKIESRLWYTLASQDNNKMLQYSVDTCNSQNLVLYWVYGIGKRSCGGCTADMECSDFKFIESTYSCDEVQQKVFDCLQYKYQKI